MFLDFFRKKKVDENPKKEVQLTTKQKEEIRKKERKTELIDDYESYYKKDIIDDISIVKKCIKFTPCLQIKDDCKGSVDIILENITDSYTVEALYFLNIKANLQKAKQSFYLGAKMQLLHKKFFDKPFIEVLPHYEVASFLLSDSPEIIEKFKNLKLSDKVYQEDLKIGRIYILIQASLGSKKEFKNMLEVYRKTSVKLKKNIWMKINIEFFDALYNGDKDGMLKVINIFLSKKYHNPNNTHNTLRDIISIVATAYAKLAYIYGYELEIDNNLIPVELLPVKPNDEYWEYDFMKEGKYKDVI